MELLSLLLPAISSAKSRREINDLVSVWCWPGADSQTQSTQPEERNSTSKCGVMLQRGCNHTHAASAEHKPSFHLFSTVKEKMQILSCFISGK